jgi:hypothetical protein
MEVQEVPADWILETDVAGQNVHTLTPSPKTDFTTNRLLRILRTEEQTLVGPHIILKRLRRNQILFEPGDEVETTWFPCQGTVGSLLIVSLSGREVEAATIGWEGAIGGIVSAGSKPPL